MKLGTTTLSVTTAGRPRQKYASGGGGSASSGPVVWNDISTATFVRKTQMDFGGRDPMGVYFKPDGTRMFVSMYSPNYQIKEFILSTPWDISTYGSGENHSVQLNGYLSSTRGRPHDIFFKPDGLTMWYADYLYDYVVQHDLSSAWDLSTINLNHTAYFDVVGESRLRGLWFKPDGTEMFVHGTGGDRVRRFTLTTPWDITTASFVHTSSSMGAYPHSLFLKPDGTKLFSTDSSGDRIKQWVLPTPFDVSSVSIGGIIGGAAATQLLVGSSYLPAVSENNPSAIYITDDGTRLYMAGQGGNQMVQFDL